MTIAQEKVLETLLELDQVKPADLNALANLVRPGLAQQRHATTVEQLRNPAFRWGTTQTE